MDYKYLLRNLLIAIERKISRKKKRYMRKNEKSESTMFGSG